MLFDTTTPSNWVDAPTLLTFGGATAAVFGINVVARKVFRVNHPGVPFVASTFLAFALAASQAALHTVMGWVVAIVNSCMLFCATVGANEVVTDAAEEKPVGKGEQQGKQPKRPVPALTSFFPKTIPPEKPMPKANEQPLPIGK
jgi:hypothetical protein